MKKSIVSALAAVSLFAAGRPLPAGERSFVGAKLPDMGFVDTEGHTVRPRYYQGSVLVMLTGIPW